MTGRPYTTEPRDPSEVKERHTLESGRTVEVTYGGEVRVRFSINRDALVRLFTNAIAPLTSGHSVAAVACAERAAEALGGCMAPLALTPAEAVAIGNIGRHAPGYGHLREGEDPNEPGINPHEFYRRLSPRLRGGTRSGR